MKQVNYRERLVLNISKEMLVACFKTYQHRDTEINHNDIISATSTFHNEHLLL